MEDIVSFPTLQWTLSESVYQRSYLVPAKKIDEVARMSATSYKAVNQARELRRWHKVEQCRVFQTKK